MSTFTILNELPNLFRYADVQKFTGHANMFLLRALKRGMIERLTRGVYVNTALKGYPRVEEAACFIRPPCYISCEWALNRHGITIQSPAVCTVLTLSTAVGASRRLTYAGVTLEFSSITGRLFSGFTMEDGYALATPEKALLDTLYFRRKLPVADELELEMINPMVLKETALSFPMRVREEIEKLFQNAGS